MGAEASDRYNEILAVSTQMISEKGYKDATIQKICDAVGIHKSTFFHYFDNKEELLFEILRISMHDVAESIRMILKDKNLDPEDKLKKAIYNHIIRLAKFRDNVNVYLSELRFLSPKKREAYYNIRIFYADCFVKIIKQIQEKGGTHFRGLDPKMVAYAILGMCNWTVKWLNPDGLRSPEEIASIFYQVINQKRSSD